MKFLIKNWGNLPTGTSVSFADKEDRVVKGVRYSTVFKIAVVKDMYAP